MSACSAWARWGRAMGSVAASMVLVSVALAGCGGKARDPGRAVVDAVGDSPFLTECAESCSDGFECLGGVCTRSCSSDAECADLAIVSTTSSCLDQAFRRAGMCGIECGTDEDCQHLGAGSWCNRAYCVAGDLDSLPASFEAIELRQLGQGPGPDTDSVCFTQDFLPRLHVSARTEELSWRRCEWQAASANDAVIGGSSRMSPLAMDRVRAAYRALELSDQRSCVPGMVGLRLRLEPPDGPEMLFSDAEHSACPVDPLEPSSFVSGLNELFDTLLELSAVE